MLEASTSQRDLEGVSSGALRSQPRGAAIERAISPRLAPVLMLAGGVLVSLGGLGTWVRATIRGAGATIPEEVGSVAGRDEPGGWILLVVGLVTVAAAFAWLAGSPRVRMVAPVVSVAAIVFASVRLALLDGRASQMAEEATTRTDIDAFHAGFGWGAWLLLAGAVLLALGLLAGVLRELDLRRAS